jgi:hypothetical protein
MKKILYPAFAPLLLSFLLAAGILLSAAGCVSQPAPDTGGDKQAPDWAMKKPQDDATYKYFVGSGNSPKGNAVDAEKTAVKDIIDQIVMYIGVQITSDTTATARASLDKYQADLTQTVTTKGATTVAGFEVQEKFPVNRKNGELMMYILVKYDKVALEKQKKEMEKIFREWYEAITKPRDAGMSLKAEGKYYEAAAKFLEAASAAAKSQVANAGIYFEENVNQAKECLEKINFVKLNDNLTGLVGQALPEPFKMKVVAGADENSAGVANVNVKITYMELSSGGKKRDKSVTAKTKSDGTLAFEHPIPQFVGKEKVTVYLDINPYLESLENIPAGKEDILQGLEDMAVSRKAVFDFMVESNAKNIGMGLVILDMDEEGSPMAKAETQSSILAALTAEKFKIKNLAINPKEIADKSDFDVIELLTGKFKGQVARAVFGTARILSYSDNSGKKFAKCSATIQVVDLDSGEVLLTLVKNGNGMGNDEKAAASNAFKTIGADIGKDIKNQLK